MDYRIEIAKDIEDIAKIDTTGMPKWCDFIKSKVTYAKEDWVKKSRPEDMCCLAYTEDNNVIGFVYLRSDFTSNEIVDGKTYSALELGYIRVDEEHRRTFLDVEKGVSDLMLEEILSVMKNPICIASPNERATRLLKRHGFVNGLIYINTDDPKLLNAFKHWVESNSFQPVSSFYPKEE